MKLFLLATVHWPFFSCRAWSPSVDLQHCPPGGTVGAVPLIESHWTFPRADLYILSSLYLLYISSLSIFWSNDAFISQYCSLFCQYVDQAYIFKGKQRLSCLKGAVLLSFTQNHVATNQYDLLWNTKKDLNGSTDYIKNTNDSFVLRTDLNWSHY